ncbi:MAG: hypothetical protein ACFFDT_36715, partial [Candidatus Hodarchaeota archaeon]
SKRNRFVIYSFGWFLSIVSTFIFLISMYTPDPLIGNLAYVSSGILIALGTLFIGIGIISYFTKIRKEYYFLLIGLFIVLPPISLLLDRSVAQLMLNLERIFVYGFLLFIGIKHKQRVIKISLSSYILFLTGTSFSLVSLLLTQYVLTSDFLVILYFGLEIWLAVILILFLIHLEHSISIQDKFLLKDAYSHDLANKLQKIVGYIDLAMRTEDQNQYEEAQRVLHEANELLFEIRKL